MEPKLKAIFQLNFKTKHKRNQLADGHQKSHTFYYLSCFKFGSTARDLLLRADRRAATLILAFGNPVCYMP